MTRAAARTGRAGPGEARRSSRADKNTRTRNVTCGNYTSCERRRRGKERSGGRCSGICVQSVKMPASRRRPSRFADAPDWSRCGETLRPSRTGELRPRDGFSVAAARSSSVPRGIPVQADPKPASSRTLRPTREEDSHQTSSPKWTGRNPAQSARARPDASLLCILRRRGGGR